MPFLVHPLIVHFPVALWLTSALFDVLFLRSGDLGHLRASQWLVGLGLLGAVASVASGYVDYLPLVAQGIGQEFVTQHRVHQLVAAAATGVYLVSFLARWRRPALSRPVFVGLAVLGAVLIAATGYIGGELRRVM
ncbi:MAG: DUF2231 domain-containing protein [Armatimonadota bacterium]|nr:DUF2231 domain-containing protein [Armatimonadota bacterium]MDR7532829.1 DUF2231 domain-containing protein [Armatimonadota bacterium]MDR7535167.1 DUF2231 domain-containing protein [Armatimonadota bacterium]